MSKKKAAKKKRDVDGIMDGKKKKASKTKAPRKKPKKEPPKFEAKITGSNSSGYRFKVVRRADNFTLEEFGPFEKKADAQSEGKRWIRARLKSEENATKSREAREAEGFRQIAKLDAARELVRLDVAKLNSQIKAIDRERKGIIEEINDPQLDINFEPEKPMKGKVTKLEALEINPMFERKAGKDLIIVVIAKDDGGFKFEASIEQEVDGVHPFAGCVTGADTHADAIKRCREMATSLSSAK